MMRFGRGFGARARRAAVTTAMMALVATAGCGGGDDDGGGGIQPEPCSITNVTTGTQASWLVGVDGPVNLRWDRTGTAEAVKIELLKAGSVVHDVVPSTDNDGFFLWLPSTGGQPDGSDFGLRVTALGEAGCSGERNGLTMRDVSGCELAWNVVEIADVIAGQTLNLSWTSTATTGTVDIELWQDDLGSEPQLVGVVVAGTDDDGAYTWEPIDSFHFGSNDWFVLRLADPIVPDCEVWTETFRMTDTVVCSCAVSGFPVGGTFAPGSTMSLFIEQENGSGLVDLRLVAGALPVTNGTIATNVPVGQYHDWVVTDYGFAGGERTRFRIRATDSADGYCVGQSDVFTIPR
ncbi:MAG: hypothetical protein IPK64_06080 [bacterium]|nr:hypothetical protein [bacterium]